MNRKKGCFTPTDIVGTLHKHHILVTRQRQDVIAGMCRLRKVEDAEALWMYLIQHRKISVAAVYTTLNILIRFGLVFRKATDGRKASYQMACFQC